MHESYTSELGFEFSPRFESSLTRRAVGDGLKSNCVVHCLVKPLKVPTSVRFSNSSTGSGTKGGMSPSDMELWESSSSDSSHNASGSTEKPAPEVRALANSASLGHVISCVWS